VSYRSFVCSAAALAVASTLLAGVSPAHGIVLLPGAPGSPTYAKPSVVSHPDRAPSVPGANSPQPSVLGAAVPAPAVPRADGSGSGRTHALVPASTALISGGYGTNQISFGSFDNGDIVVVLDPFSLTGHAGLFDHRFYVDIWSYAVISANVSPVNGVQREQCLKYRASEWAWGLWVPSEADHAVAARDLAYRQIGKPYSITSSKTDLRSFYCSKLVWVAWRYTSGLDLDADGGIWVWPVDLVNSRYTRVFGYWS
jgi:cell wall-associated NlpC family hydrolase